MSPSATSEIEREHQVIQAKLSAVNSICPNIGTLSNCSGCPHDKMAECNTAAAEVAEGVFSYLVAHFGREEQLMKESGLFRQSRDMCEQHMQDHGDMSDAILKILVHLSHSDPITHLNSLADFVQSWLGEHVEQHDAVLLNHLEQPP